jgi:hypothetical protein
MVGMVGFEPTTLGLPDRYANQTALHSVKLYWINPTSFSANQGINPLIGPVSSRTQRPTVEPVTPKPRAISCSLRPLMIASRTAADHCPSSANT